MLVFAIISYAMPLMSGRKIHDNQVGHLSFWFSNVGMIGMTAAFVAAGIAQVYLERIAGMDFGKVQNELQSHFFVLIITAVVFLIGILMFVKNFLAFGKPTDEALGQMDEFEALV